LQALAYHAQGNLPAALLPLQHALVLAEPEGYVRMFVDEGPPMAQLLAAVRRLPEAAAREIMPRQGLPTFADKLLAAFEAEHKRSASESPLPDDRTRAATQVSAPALHPPALQPPALQGFIEPLSQRELEVLRLIAQGLSNREISERLFLALSTVKGHSRIIFDKLQVHRRTEAVARARELGLL